MQYNTTWLNENQGLIEFFGLVLVIPLAILSEQILSKRRQKKNEENLSLLLLHELWINLSFVGQIGKNLNSIHHFHYFPISQMCKT